MLDPALIIALTSMIGTVGGLIVMARRDEVKAVREQLSRAEKKIEALLEQRLELKTALAEANAMISRLQADLEYFKQDRAAAIRAHVMECTTVECPLITELRKHHE